MKPLPLRGNDETVAASREHKDVSPERGKGSLKNTAFPAPSGGRMSEGQEGGVRKIPELSFL